MSDSERFRDFAAWYAQMKIGPAITWPVEVATVVSTEPKYDDPDLGKFVAVRIVGEEQTRLGLYLGRLVTGERQTAYHPVDKELQIIYTRNPAMFVPAVRRIVWGYESWWSVIDDPAKLRDITDEDIENVDYVKAIRQMMAGEVATEPTA